MIRKLLILFIAFIGLASSLVNAEEVVIVRAGTFLRVMNLAEISTLMADAEDEVVFMNTQDMYVYETNVIPANTKIYGEVEEVLEPVQGRDGALKILIYKMITPDKKVYKVKGHIYSENNNYLGGKTTQATYYKKVPHYNFGMRPFLKAVPLNVLEMGQHTVVLPGAELFMIIEEDIIAK